MPSDPRSHRVYKRARERLKAQRLPCWLCGYAIDYTLRWPHPWSFSADHVVELDRGGHLTSVHNLRAAHLRCNQARGARYVNAKRSPSRRTSRVW